MRNIRKNTNNRALKTFVGFSIGLFLLAVSSVSYAVNADFSDAIITDNAPQGIRIDKISAFGKTCLVDFKWDSVLNKLVPINHECYDDLVCFNPIEESSIGGPGTTGYPFILGNRNVANVDGEITALGVDRWNVDATWTVSLWNDSCQKLAEIVVTGGNGWYFENIPPVSVSAGDIFYVGYEVDNPAGSYLYRDTPSPVDVGAYTVEYATYNSVGSCPSDLNGNLVSPVDVTFCTAEIIPATEDVDELNDVGTGIVATDVE